MVQSKLFFIGAIFVFSTLFYGCATIISGTSQVLTFQSNPSGAEVVINGTSIGVTPLTTTVARKNDTKVVIKKDGYKEQSFVLKQKLEPWFWGNIIFGGVIGSTTDGLSGATVEYSPDQYYTTLEPVEPPSPPTIINTTDNKKNKVIRYILVNYNKITAELNVGSGEYLSALYEFLNISQNERNTALLTIKNLYIEKPEIPDFAEAVAQSLNN